MQGGAVNFREDRDRSNAHLTARPNDAHRDLTAISYEDLAEHSGNLDCSNKGGDNRLRTRCPKRRLNARVIVVTDAAGTKQKAPPGRGAYSMRDVYFGL